MQHLPDPASHLGNLILTLQALYLGDYVNGAIRPLDVDRQGVKWLIAYSIKSVRMKDTDGAVFDFANMVGVQGLNIRAGAASSMRIWQVGHVVNTEGHKQRSRTRDQDQGRKPSQSLFARLLNNLSERKREVSSRATVRATRRGCPNCGSRSFDNIPIAVGPGAMPIPPGGAIDGIVRRCMECGETGFPGDWN